MAAITVFSGLHIAGMVGQHKLVMFLIGGTYDFHFSVTTLIYKFRKDVMTCILNGGALWLIDSRREPRQAGSDSTAPRTDPATLAPETVWLRDGSSRIRTEPREILTTRNPHHRLGGKLYRISHGRRAHHLVPGTLAAEEARPTKFNIVRVHRTRLVNLSRVTGLKTGPNRDFELTLDAGPTIGGSRRYRDAVAAIEALAADPTPFAGDKPARR